ncbi:chaplin [Streptomyces sp. NBRC 110035]|uniref:chaplin n=1 Tax=Streptomyces sp. NBRC 110035 TaxID=1547867 RepID=UPI0005AA3AF8|nr:chaplin [Streptomyces sp. NBRC 110035]
MRQTLSRGAFAAAAATGILSLYGAPALADTHAEGAATNSPGVLSGNNVQAPIEVPVNACGNTIGAASALNAASGNTCVNGSHQDDRSDHRASGTSQDRSDGGGGAYAEGVAKDSPGVASGNNVQAPVHAPVNACGNSVNVVGALNEASDNTCVNGSHQDDRSDHRASGTSQDRSDGGAYAEGVAEGSPGVLSGNLIQLPVHAPVNACGNSVNVIGLLNSAYGNDCGNGHTPDEPGDEPETPLSPPDRTHTPPAHETHTPPPAPGEEPPHLAETGSDSVLAASAAGASLLVGGALLYRRGRAARR